MNQQEIKKALIEYANEDLRLAMSENAERGQDISIAGTKLGVVSLRYYADGEFFVNTRTGLVFRGDLFETRDYLVADVYAVDIQD